MSHKYMVLKLTELRNLLTAEEQQQFSALMQSLNARRAEAMPEYRPPHYFVLNMNDKFAIPAVEAYVAEIDQDESSRTLAGVKSARKTAFDAREWAITNTDGNRVPT